MKKHLQNGLLLVMILFSGNLAGQATDPTFNQKKRMPETHLDLLLNVVTTNLNYGKSNGELSGFRKSNIGAQVGASFQAGVTSNFSLVSEFYFIMKGGQLNAGNPLTGSKSTLRFYTLELPVLARVHVGKFYFNAGPSLAYNVRGTRKMEGHTRTVSFGNSVDGFKRLDAGAQFGAGYRFKVRKKDVSLDVRYTTGLSNISRTGEMYSRYLNISLHFSNPWKTNPLARKNHI